MQASHIEDIEVCFSRDFRVPNKRQYPVVEDVLGGLLALLRVIPQTMDRRALPRTVNILERTLNLQHLFANTAGHEQRVEERLAAFCLTCDSH